MIIPFKKTEELIEKLADIEHDRWSTWMTFMYDKFIISDVDELSAFENVNYKEGDANPMMLDLLLDKELSDKWQRQIDTQYQDLTESEKDSDRVFARGIVDTLSEFLKEFGISMHTEKVEVIKPVDNVVRCYKCKTKFRYAEGSTSSLDENNLCRNCRDAYVQDTLP